MMEGWHRRVLLLWLAVVTVVNTLGNAAEAEKPVVKNLTKQLLQVIPPNADNSSVTKLVLEGNLITLNESDRRALTSYPALVELHLGGNLVTNIPAKFFCVVPNLRVLSLTRNNISCLDPEAFSGLDVLTELDLSHNLLTSLPAQFTKGLNHLQMLNLQENPWNCSCPLLSTVGEIQAANVTIGGSQVICASPPHQAGRDLLKATALCSPPTPPPPAITTNPRNLTASDHSQQTWSPTSTLKTTFSPSQNRSISRDQTPARSNTWMFTVCVAALAVATSTLIVCAVKGPSWYKLFHNYRHRRLYNDDDNNCDGEEGDFVPNVFSETGTHLSHQTFSFEQVNGQTEEEEEDDDYFEDPYIKVEEFDSREEILAEP